MGTERRRSLTLCFLLVLSTFGTMFAPGVVADSRIVLDLSNDHVTLAQSGSENVTLTVENNDSAIHDFELSLDLSLTPSAWNVTLADTVMHQLGPSVFGFSNSTTVIVRLAHDATLADHGSVTILVNHSGTNVSSAITLYLSVASSYLPDIEHTAVGDAGLITMDTGESVNISVPVSNLGSAQDHIVLAVDEEPDLSGFWSNWNGGSNNTGGNGSGNNSGGNGTGNNTGGNGTGNNTGGNNTGNGTGNVTTGPTEFILSLTSVATNLTSTLDSVNLTANGSYLVSWVLEENGSMFPYDSGLYNWTSNGTNHSWTSTWNVTVGEWCFSADISHNLTPISSVATCTNVTATGGNGTSMGRAIPSGWDVRWMESTHSNMSAGETRMATLMVSVPHGETPGDYGFSLTAGSAMGNFSISETIVVHVNGTHNLTMSADDGGMLWLPNSSAPVTFTVENVGSSEAESIYSLLSANGECIASLMEGDANGIRIDNGETDTFSVSVTIDINAHVGDTCELTVEAWDDIGEVSYVFTSSVTVGQSWGFSLHSVDDNLTVSPGGSISGIVQIKNTGTESDCIRLNVQTGVEDVNISSSLSYQQVNRGEVIDLSFTVSTQSDTSAVGTHQIHLSANCSSSTTSVDIFTNLTISPWSSIRMTGPLGGAFDVGADTPATVDMTLTNDGTGSANATLDWSGAPAGFTIMPSVESTVEPGVDSTMSLSVSIDDDISSGSYSFTVMAMNPADGSTWDSVSLVAQVTQRSEVRLLMASDALPVSNRADAVFYATVINDGNDADTFSLSLSGASGFEASVSPQSIQLDGGESGNVTVTLRRTGAQGDVTSTLTVTSQSNINVSDSVNILATFPNVDVRSTLAITGDEVTGDGIISMTLFLENLGEAEDTILVTGPAGFSCDHPAQLTMAAGSPASSHTVNCSPHPDTLAGEQWLNFTATSLADASASSSTSVLITVLPMRTSTGNPMLDVAFTGNDWSIAWNSSAVYTVTVTNTGNEQVSGHLLLAGDHALDLFPEWNHVESGISASVFSVAPGASSTYSLALRASGEPSVGTLDLRIEASGTLSDGHGFSIASNTVQMTVEFEPDDPTEAALWKGGPMVNAANLAIAMLSGWLFAGLLILWIRRSSKMREKQAVEDAWDEAAAEESKDDDLKAGEIRADEEGTARCYACEARIRLPTEKDPPFRFKCPTCDVMNRVVGPREDA